MGAFFGSIAVKIKDQYKVKEFLQKEEHTAYLSPPAGDWIVIYDKRADDDLEHAFDICTVLSRTLGTTALAFLVNDSDYLFYALCRNGGLYDNYISNASRFYNDFPTARTPEVNTLEKFINVYKGRPGTLARLTGKAGFLNLGGQNLESKIKNILERKYVLAEDRLSDLTDLLGIKYATHGYEYLHEEGKDIFGKEFEKFTYIKGNE